MTHVLEHERQLLSTEEFALVEQTHHPLLGQLTDKDLADLCRLVRERRDRAQQIAARQRREMRGKSDPKGTRAAGEDTGSRGKSDLLAAAVQRLNEELTSRKAKVARQPLIESAARALELRRASKVVSRPFSDRTPGTGQHAKAGAPLSAPRNPAMVGAVSQHTKNMQAKRDAK